MIRKEVGPFCRLSSSVCLCWELEEPQGIFKVCSEEAILVTFLMQNLPGLANCVHLLALPHSGWSTVLKLTSWILER